MGNGELHLVLDLQACQSESAKRGIGRYSLALAKAMAAQPRGHRITLLLNAAMGQSIEFLRSQFDPFLAQDDIVVWEGLGPSALLDPANGFRRRASEALRMDALRALQPDVVHVASLFEGMGDNAVCTLTGQEPWVTVVTLYDLIPLARKDVYLTDARIDGWYMEKLGYLRKAHQLLGISAFSCNEARELLACSGERLSNISGAADDIFVKLDNTESFRPELMARYGLSRPFVMYAGGFDSRKNIAGLIRAFAKLPVVLRQAHQLAVVGSAPAPDRAVMEKVAVESGLTPDDIIFTGYVPDPDLVKLYNLCAIYVFPSLQEGFGLPALEAMCSGAVVIGSDTSSLPEVIGMEEALFDPSDEDAIAAKIVHGLTDEGFRKRFREHAQLQSRKFSWAESARLALNGIETAFAREHALHSETPAIGFDERIDRTVHALLDDDAAGLATDADWICVAKSLAANSARADDTQRWYVDISNLAVHDAGTGIQRVVRHILDELVNAPPTGCRIEPVYMDGQGVFRHAHVYCNKRYSRGLRSPEDDVVEMRRGDVFLGLDLAAHLVPQHVAVFRRMRDFGVRQYFVVYDLLPLLRPDCFDPQGLPLFQAWYKAIAEVSDGVLCISRAVADEFASWLWQSQPARLRPLDIGWFHLGADLIVATTTASGVHSHDDHLDALGERPTFLMVGTIEPRKGHAQALSAFERLWEEGVEANLFIIGKPGWLVDGLIARLRQHPQRGQRLFWLEKAGDDLLLASYQRASALLMASEGEGFGLPLIEAAHHGVPLVVRDLPVFREIAGEHAHYFQGLGAEDLAASVRLWLELNANGNAPASNGLQWLTWKQAASRLVEVLAKQNWVHRWVPNGRAATGLDASGTGAFRSFPP